MIIENFKEKGLLIHGLSVLPESDFNDGFYITKDMNFFVRPSIFPSEKGKWVIIPSTPEIAMKINHERFKGTEEEVLEKLKTYE